MEERNSQELKILTISCCYISFSFIKVCDCRHYMLTTITKEEVTKTRRNNDNKDGIFQFFLRISQQAREQRRRGTF
jgi:hypothetical protein